MTAAPSYGNVLIVQLNVIVIVVVRVDVLAMLDGGWARWALASWPAACSPTSLDVPAKVCLPILIALRYCCATLGGDNNVESSFLLHF